MTKDHDRRLKTRFPLVFRALGVRRQQQLNVLGRPSMATLPIAYGTECGPGWYALVAGLARTLERQISRLPTRSQREIYAAQVKEKFGHLRFYMSSSTETMDAAISRARERSLHICEDCGRAGKLRKRKWLATLCDAHARRRGTPEMREFDARQKAFAKAARETTRWSR
jgi:hypothetical protein